MSRHDQKIKDSDDARRKLRAGIAKAALIHKRQRPMVDSYGVSLPRAQEMAERHNERTLERWAKKSTRTIVSMG